MNLVTLHHVGVAYDGYEALKNVDLTIAQDDFLGIIGPNGGGKTTLVKAILGTVPHTGEVVLAPELFRGKERLIGYMPQISNFDRTFPISVLEVVLSGLQGHRGFVSRYTKEDRAKALRLLETSGIGETARSPIGEVSGGQMQRALLCRAVISDPKLLILDEPANFVDNKFEKELYRTLHELNARMAIVMVSHDVGTISSVVNASPPKNFSISSSSVSAMASLMASIRPWKRWPMSGRSTWICLPLSYLKAFWLNRLM